MLVAFKYRLYPTSKQKRAIHFTLDRCRFLYNRLLEERILAYRSEGKSLNYYDQANTFHERKQHIPALKQVHSQVLQDVAKRLDKAFQAFFRRIENGEEPGFPRFKPEPRYDSFTYPQGGHSLVGNKVRLSKIGDVKIKLHRQPQGTIKTCTITVKNGKYYACFSCEVEGQPLPASTDHAHKVSRELVNRYGFIAFENLNVQGMIKNHHLAKSIADAGWSQLVQFTAYKAESAGRVVVQVNPRNTSQACSQCGEMVKKALSVRVHRCGHCGYTADRDENAARNIRQRAFVS